MTRNEAADTLRNLLPRGTTVYSMHRHTTGNGTRFISLMVAHPQPVLLDRLAGLVLGRRLSVNGGIDGGMQGGFELAYDLGCALYGASAYPYALDHEEVSTI